MDITTRWIKMFNQIIDGLNITIDLKPGIYVMGDISSTGKSYLCKSLKKLRTYGYKVDGYTYSDYLRKVSLRELVGDLDKKIEYLVIDRYDMYKNEFSDYIQELSKYCVVLIDSKEYIDMPFELASLEIKRPNLLEVT